MARLDTATWFRQCEAGLIYLWTTSFIYNVPYNPYSGGVLTHGAIRAIVTILWQSLLYRLPKHGNGSSLTSQLLRLSDINKQNYNFHYNREYAYCLLEGLTFLCLFIFRWLRTSIHHISWSREFSWIKSGLWAYKTPASVKCRCIFGHLRAR